MNSSLIQDLHAAISRRDWSATETAANRLRDDIQEAIKVLAGTQIGSLPNDYPISHLASDVEFDRRERARSCELMAKDWADFCESMGVNWDNQDAVAREIKEKFEAISKSKWRVRDSHSDPI